MRDLCENWGAHDRTAPRQRIPATAAARRADVGAVRLGRRDIDGLILCAEHFGAPYDLLAAALGAQPARLRGITARWRRAGYAATGRLGPGPAWCWLTPAGMAAAGLGYPATRPALARLAHIRAVLAARLWLQASPAWSQGQAWWHSERRLRAALRPGSAPGTCPTPRSTGPASPPARTPGQVWAVEVELTPKPLARTTRIMGGLLGPARYAQVIYLTTPAARLVVTQAADSHSRRPGRQSRDPGPAAVRVRPGAVMTVMSWIRLTGLFTMAWSGASPIPDYVTPRASTIDSAPHGLIEDNRSCGGGVQGTSLPYHGNPQQHVTLFPPCHGHSGGLVADYQDGRLREIYRGDIFVSLLVGPDNDNWHIAGTLLIHPFDYLPVRWGPHYGHAEQRARARPYALGVIGISGMPGGE